MDTLIANAHAQSFGSHDPDPVDLRQIESDHRLANGLSIAAAILTRQRRQVTDLGEAKAAMATAAARLVAMARLHRTLCRTRSAEDVDLGDFLTSLCDDLADVPGIELRIDSDRVNLPARAAAQVGIVVSEMAVNAVKHSSDDGGCPVLTVEADVNGLGETRLRIHDDGPGFPDGFDFEQGGVGMAVIRSTVEGLGGYVYLMPRFGAYLQKGAGLEIVLPPCGPRRV